MSNKHGIKLTRRQLLGAGSGLLFSFNLPGLNAADAQAPGAEEMLKAWVLIKPDNSISIFSPAAEMGQGSFTAIPMIFAEELDADWSLVSIEPSPSDDDLFKNPTDWIPGIMLTLGSSTVSGYYDSVRLLGAQARAVLLNAVARHWQVDNASLVTQGSIVLHRDSGRSISYGEASQLVDDTEAVPVVTQSDLKDEVNFSIIGSDLPRVDLPEKVNGEAKFSIDIDLPGMVYATVQHSPVAGSQLLTIDNREELLQRAGIIDVIALPQSVAIVASHYQAALDAEGELQTSWSDVPTLATFSDQTGLEQHLRLVRDHTNTARV